MFLLVFVGSVKLDHKFLIRSRTLCLLWYLCIWKIMSMYLFCLLVPSPVTICAVNMHHSLQQRRRQHEVKDCPPSSKQHRQAGGKR